jgi:hypothetical protein
MIKDYAERIRRNAYKKMNKDNKIKFKIKKYT